MIAMYSVMKEVNKVSKFEQKRERFWLEEVV